MKLTLTLKASSFSRSLLRKLFIIVLVGGRLITTNASAQTSPTYYPSLTFNSPTLISGVDGEVNAVYKFPTVMAGVDAEVTVTAIVGGARLIEIDNTTGAGYYDAFQPYVGAAPNDTSYIDWKITFKKEGTSIDTILAVLAVTGVDVDGDGSYLKEFIQAATPGSFALEPGTFLNFSFDGVRSTATSQVDNYPLIDTAQRKAMFQMNFTNINTILYRNGAISTYGSEEIRQTCIYFKSFFNTPTVLPVKLLSFDARKINSTNTITWSAVNEENISSYTVEKSTNGLNWKAVKNVNAINGNGISNYTVNDVEKNMTTVLYRLRQTAVTGSGSYSKSVKIEATLPKQTVVGHTYIVNNQINLTVNAAANDDYIVDVYTISGAKITQVQNKVVTGSNKLAVQLPANHSNGIYLLIIRNKSGELIYNSKIASI